MVGIDISDRSIKIAEVDLASSPRLRTVCWSPLTPHVMRRGVIQDIPVATVTLQETLKKCSPMPVSSDEVVASIPETQSFVRVIDLPTMPDYEVSEAVQWAVRQHIPFDLERVYLDWQALPVAFSQDRKRRQVLVGAVQRDVVDPLLEVLDGAGLRVIALELEAQAIVRSLLPRDAYDVHGVLVVDLGATSTNVIYFDGGVMRFTTSVQVGGDDLTQKLAQTLHVAPSIAAEKKTTIGLQMQEGEEANVVIALHEATIELLEKIERTVREMAAQLQEDHPVRAILLSGGSANLPGIRNVVAEVFPGIPVEMGNPWTNISFANKDNQPPLSPQDASHFITAIGLALRLPEEK